MKNSVQNGDTVTITAPAALASGEGVLVGHLFGVAVADYESGDTRAQVVTRGVFHLPKVAAQAWSPGALVYWSTSAGKLTTASSGNTLVGVALEAAANPSDTGTVRLNGGPVV